MPKTKENKEGGALGGPKGIRGVDNPTSRTKLAKKEKKVRQKQKQRQKKKKKKEGRKMMPQVTAAKVTLQIAEREDVEGS